MPGFITEAELREYWQNGRGGIPMFPPGTRFSPSAREFLRDHRIEPKFSADADVINLQHPAPFLEMRPSYIPPKEKEALRKTIFTETDIDDFVTGGSTTLNVNENIILTALAQDRAQKLGLKLVRQAIPPPSILTPVSHNLALLPTPPHLPPEKDMIMGKTFYTDVDIERLQKEGITCLQITDDVVLTDLAREKTQQFGIELVRIVPLPSTPSSSSPSLDDGLFKQVKAAVIARLGINVNEQVIDSVIRRVLEGLK